MNKKFAYDYPRPAVATDLVVISKGQLLLIRRGFDPYKNCWALPGGFVDENESLEEAARRELLEETHLTTTHLTQVGAYSDPKRDPRTRVISFAFLILLDQPPPVTAGDDAKEARWFALEALPELAFDHQQIVCDALARKDQHV